VPVVTSIRLLLPSDSVAALTALLHRAYASLGAAGLNYTAVDQSVEVTTNRIGRGSCVVALVDDRIVGTLVTVGAKPNGSCPWYRLPTVASAHQFGVEPEFQRNGVGSTLMQWAETWAQRRGFAELAIDTAEPAEHLVHYYSRRGYRFIEFAQWPGKRYRSVIMSKALPHAP
jgi:GNAT superfamily N-acetyltransferase